jgi:hypothetical protein
MQDLVSRAATFDIIPQDGGWCLSDTCQFNPWPSVSVFVFAKKEDAETYAWKCDDFKRGRRWTLDDPRPETLLVTRPDLIKRRPQLPHCEHT